MAESGEGDSQKTKREKDSDSRNTEKQRVDLLLVSRGICESREKAKELISLGKVFIGGKKIKKPSEKIPKSAEIEVKGEGINYVSRGYLKIKRAFEVFRFDVRGKVCLDVGCSTGGFTQFLLECGARMVYAVDIGRGVLHPSLRQHPRVFVMEGVDGKKLNPSDFAEIPEFAVCDVSFTSVVPILRAIAFVPEVIALCKPNFEVPRKYLKKGILKDPKIMKLALRKVITQVSDIFRVMGVTWSYPPGSGGNVEFFVRFRRGETDLSTAEKMIDSAVDDAVSRWDIFPFLRG